MFKKKPQIKNLSPLRSSDRRKLADQIIAEYNVAVPSSTAAEPNQTEQSTQTKSDQLMQEPVTSPEGTSAPTLSSIRASLVPETCLSARFTTHAGASATLVSGTVYVGAHPAQEERILWIQYGKDSKLYPTVYTLWQNPGLVPLLHTQDFVVEKLRTGADLMTPGLVGSPPWPERARRGAVVAVAGVGKESVPVLVGVCKIDISSLGRVQGLKGAAVEGVHWEGDEIWSWSQSGIGGRRAPDRIDGWEALIKNLGHGINNLDLEDEEDELQADGGVALESSTADLQNGNGIGHANEEPSVEAEGQDEEEHEPTTAEVDEAFYNAFLYSIYDLKKNGQPPNYGLDLPVQPSFLISNMIQPHLRIQNAHYTIKKTSWKNTKKFIKFLDKKVLVKSKDRNGGETVILDVDFNDQQIKDFVPYRLPKPKSTAAAEDESGAGPAGSKNSHSGSDTSIGQKLSLIIVYRASAKLVPDLIPSKSVFYSASQISTYLKTYIENHPELTQQTSSKRYIKLDPFIANNILHSNPSGTDTKILAAGEIGRDILLKRIIEDDHLCIPHWILLNGSENEVETQLASILNSDSLTPSTTTTGKTPKPKSGPPPTVSIILEKRTGTKTVTRLSGLEAFNINPNILGPELQRKCAGSASVGQLVGGKPGMMEITVQGDQRDVIEKELAKRGVKVSGSGGGSWINTVDKTGKKGKK